MNVYLEREEESQHITGALEIQLPFLLLGSLGSWPEKLILKRLLDQIGTWLFCPPWGHCEGGSCCLRFIGRPGEGSRAGEEPGSRAVARGGGSSSELRAWGPRESASRDGTVPVPPQDDTGICWHFLRILWFHVLSLSHLV